MMATSIKIIALPHGEAPLEVRSGWIGCVLPCETECGHIPAYAGGVLSGPSLDKVAGFSVPQAEALAVLETHAPDSAFWFRTHGFPQAEKCFRFKNEEVEVVTQK